MRYVLRGYQEEAVNRAVSFLKGPAKYNALEVLPTGSGKSLVIANIVQALGEPTLIFQPSKEILEQNFSKLISYGFPASIYSASKGRKDISNTTFATIGSVINKLDLFKDFKYVIVDECHFVNSKGGMYSKFFENINGVKALGLTATPYRLTTDGFGGSILKFLTRTRPRIFRELIYYIQNGYLFDAGYLSKIEYKNINGFDRSTLKVNSTGADYDDRSVKNYYKEINFQRILVDLVRDIGRNSILVFTRFIEESQYIVDRIPGAVIVTGETPKKDREKIISGFKNGSIPIVCNVGVLTTGFDYPELETVVLGRPTMSLALYYQMIGRGIRPYPGKTLEVYDLCANIPLFGRIEDLKIVNGGNGKWHIESRGRRQLTNIYYGERKHERAGYSNNI